MAEYINRNALLESIRSGDGTNEHKIFAALCVSNAPAADVVEVVRCRDCKWWEARTYGGCIGKCENPLNGLVIEYLDDEDYCSYGERRE